jgi:hypothetical protein
MASAFLAGGMARTENEAARQSMARLKRVAAESIEPSLPATAFEEWLAHVAPEGVRVRWMPGDCALAPVPTPRAERPTCVRIDLVGDRVEALGWLSIQIQIQVEKGGKPLSHPRVLQILIFGRDGGIESPDTLGEMKARIGKSE